MDRVLCYALFFVVIFTSSCHGAGQSSYGKIPEFQLVKNNTIATIPHVTKTWILSFEIKPFGTINGWSSIVHLTTIDNCCELGHRIPTVVFWGNSFKLMVCSAIGTNANRCTSVEGIVGGEYNNVTIEQTKGDDGIYNISVTVNGIQELTIAHPKEEQEPGDYKNVKMYAADPWHNPANAAIKNLQFKSTGVIEKPEDIGVINKTSLAINFNKTRIISDGILECTTTGLNVIFNKTLLDERQQEGIYKVFFNGSETNPGCFLNNSNDQNVYKDLMWLGTDFTGCGVEVRNDNQNYYYNQTIMVKFGPDPVDNIVTRQEVDTYSVTCTVPWNITVNMDESTNFNVTLQKQVLKKSKESNYDVKLFRINPDSLNFVSLIHDTSNSVSVGDKLSFVVVLTTSNSAVKLVRQDCYATNAADSSSPRYNIPNECAYNDVSMQKDRFDIRAFKFFGESTAIYMTCNVLICVKPDNTGDCMGCGNKRRRREVVGLSNETGVAMKGSPMRETVTSSLIVILEEDKQKSDATSGEQRSTNFFQGTKGTIVLILIITLILIGIIVLAKKILVVPPRSTEAHSKAPEGTGHDNTG